MKYDFSTMEDVDSFVSVPEGSYLCRVAEVREGQTRDGSPRWSFRLEVVDGEHAGRTAAWDALTWSERGVHRVRLVLEAFGIDTRGEVELEPQDLVDLEAQVRVVIEEREDPITSRRQLRMRVPYQGYGLEAERQRDERAQAVGDPVDAWGGRRESSAHGSAPDDGERDSF